MKVGDLIEYRPPHDVRSLYEISGDCIVGLVIKSAGGDITKLLSTCGRKYWAVTKYCRVIGKNEGRRFN